MLTEVAFQPGHSSGRLTHSWVTWLRPVRARLLRYAAGVDEVLESSRYRVQAACYQSEKNNVGDSKSCALFDLEDFGLRPQGDAIKTLARRGHPCLTGWSQTLPSEQTNEITADYLLWNLLLRSSYAATIGGVCSRVGRKE